MYNNSILSILKFLHLGPLALLFDGPKLALITTIALGKMILMSGFLLKLLIPKGIKFRLGPRALS